MKYLKMVVVVFVALLTQNLYAQQLGKFEPKVNKYGLGKLKGASKKVFIAKFNINYEVYKSSQDFQAGGSTWGGGIRGSAKASLAVGLKGIQESDLIEKTDLLYNEFVASLEAEGLQVVTAEEAGKVGAYEDWEMLKGGTVNKSQYPGVLTIRPNDYGYFVKRVSKKGKEKTGFVNNYAALSKDLGDAIIIDVDLSVMFSEAGKEYLKLGNSAKTKIKTNLRIVDNYVITAPKKSIIAGSNSAVNVMSKVAFYYGKVGLGSTTVYEGILKSPFEIDGLIPEEKIVAIAMTNTDMTGTNFGLVHVYSADASEDTKMKMFEVDSKAYSEGTYKAASHFIANQTKGFLEILK